LHGPVPHTTSPETSVTQSGWAGDGSISPATRRARTDNPFTMGASLRLPQTRTTELDSCRPPAPYILESDATPTPEIFTGLGDPPQKLGMVLQSIVEPVVFAFEADQHTSGLTVPRDENLLGFGQAQESREIVLDLSERHLAHRTSRARQASAPLLLS
jgi:hypothetical protein